MKTKFCCCKTIIATTTASSHDCLYHFMERTDNDSFLYGAFYFTALIIRELTRISLHIRIVQLKYLAKKKYVYNTLFIARKIFSWSYVLIFSSKLPLAGYHGICLLSTIGSVEAPCNSIWNVIVHYSFCISKTLFLWWYDLFLFFPKVEAQFFDWKKLICP